MTGAVVALFQGVLLFLQGMRFALGPEQRREEWLRLLALSHLGGAVGIALGATLGLFVNGSLDAAWAWRGFLGIFVLGMVRYGVERKKWRHLEWRNEEQELKEVPLTPNTSKWWTQFSTWEWLLIAGILVGVGTAVARVVLLPLDWDGWAIWQLKAHALFQGDLHRLLTARDYQFSHPDYPLLVPAHTFWLTGSTFNPKAAQWGGLLFLLDLLALFYVEARRLAGRPLALAGCVVLLSWALTMKHAASGFADIPIAAYAFAAITALLRRDLWILSLALVGAVLTKNEGLFTLVGVLVALPFAARYWPVEPGSQSAKLLKAYGAAVPAVLAVAAWSIVKRRWSLFSDLLDPTQWARDPLALLPGRLLTILRGYAAQAVLIGPRYPGWGLLWPAVVWSLVETVQRRRWWILPLWLLVGAHFSGAAIAYLVTAADAGLHLSRSLDRLWLHVAPVALLAVLVSLAGPEIPEGGHEAAVDVAGRLNSSCKSG